MRGVRGTDVREAATFRWPRMPGVGEVTTFQGRRRSDKRRRDEAEQFERETERWKAVERE